MQIEWVPYDRLPQEFLPEQYGQQIILVLAFTYLLCIAQAVPHDLGVLSGRKLFFLSNSDYNFMLSEAHAKHDSGHKDIGG